MTCKVINSGLLCELSDEVSISVDTLTPFRVVSTGAKSIAKKGDIVFSSYDSAKGVVLDRQPFFLIDEKEVFLIYGE